MMRRFLLLFLMMSAVAAQADEPAAVTLAPAEDVVKAFPATFIGDRHRDEVVFKNASPAVSFAMCGVEAHGADKDLDAGLIDFNVPDPARAAGGITDETKEQGRDVRDFHSSVILGVTVGYRF